MLIPFDEIPGQEWDVGMEGQDHRKKDEEPEPELQRHVAVSEGDNHYCYICGSNTAADMIIQTNRYKMYVHNRCFIELDVIR
jgi:hypothetical protein